LSPEPTRLWDLPIGQAPLAFLDLEMTGLDPKTDGIVQICVERVVGGEVRERLLSLVRPEGPDRARHIHGIAPEELAAAPPFGELAEAVVAILRDAIIVAHGADHDVAFLTKAMAGAGVPWSPDAYLDTLRLSRHTFALQSHRLAAIAAHLGISQDVPHRADRDVKVLRTLFERLVELLRPHNPRELWHVQHCRRTVRREVLEAAQRALAVGEPVHVRYRARRGIQEFGFCVRDVRADLDPPLVLGYLHRTRGRRELRADRIVTIETLPHDA
jgi:DNA polymerase III subunit epsilon